MSNNNNSSKGLLRKVKKSSRIAFAILIILFQTSFYFWTFLLPLRNWLKYLSVFLSYWFLFRMQLWLTGRVRNISLRSRDNEIQRLLYDVASWSTIEVTVARFKSSCYPNSNSTFFTPTSLQIIEISFHKYPIITTIRNP